jgi:hypothetical protein
MDSERLFRFPKPQWMNSANTRTAGVYLAGGLVRTKIPPPLQTTIHVIQQPLTVNPAIVLHRPLHPNRRRQLLQIKPQRLLLPHNLRRRDPRHLLRPRHARHQ